MPAPPANGSTYRHGLGRCAASTCLTKCASRALPPGYLSGLRYRPTSELDKRFETLEERLVVLKDGSGLSAGGVEVGIVDVPVDGGDGEETGSVAQAGPDRLVL